MPKTPNGDDYGNGCLAYRSEVVTAHLLQGWHDSHSPLCNNNMIKSAIPGENQLSFHEPLANRLRDALAIGLFVVLAGYVGYSGFRLALLLWQRFS